ncbi:hypothetical protein EVAR_949_1 [Eumeta japonica]|uniref:Uncharacterized protein n=1 Tax=Eumeta variegata TaxID=151549 RepID=A0A4C1SE05_EUMVA|nr:hypothetical protein EVAR_949_1 [Eumeta japonica]
MLSSDTRPRNKKILRRSASSLDIKKIRQARCGARSAAVPQVVVMGVAFKRESAAFDSDLRVCDRWVFNYKL